MLTIYAGARFMDDLEVQLAASLRDLDEPWKARYRPWSWWPGICVHRHPGKHGWAVREWLEKELGGPSVEAMGGLRDEEVVLKVPVGSVDRAIELLAHRNGGDAGATQ